MKTNTPAQYEAGPNLRPPFYQRYKWPLILLALALAFVGFQKALITYHQHQLERLVQPAALDSQYSMYGFSRSDHCSTTYQGMFPSGLNCYNYVDKLYYAASDDELATVLKFVSDRTSRIAPDSEFGYDLGNEGKEWVTFRQTAQDPNTLKQILAKYSNTDVFMWSMREADSSKYKSKYDGALVYVCVFRAQSAQVFSYGSGSVKSLPHCSESEGIEKPIWEKLYGKSGYVVAVSFSQYRSEGWLPFYEELLR